MTLANKFSTIGHPKILVVGDVILDRYTWGDAERISPEAPVVVLRSDTIEARLGGAASVAFLLRGLAVEVTLAGVVGDDAFGRITREIARDAGIEDPLLFTVTDRPTTTKERFIGRAAGRHPHQMLRVDHESRHPLTLADAERLAQAVVAKLEDVDAVLISDYAKGTCATSLLKTILDAARVRGIPVLVDPARIDHYDRYQGATLLKPNRHEAGLAMQRTLSSPQTAQPIGREMCRRWGFDHVVITLDRDGMVWASAAGPGGHFPVTAREIYDITGAGDMALAALGLCFASGWDVASSIQLANIAAGLEVGRQGVAAISRTELLTALQPERRESGKVLTLEQLLPVLEVERQTGRTIVFTNGCFDLLHVGHVQCLEEAARLGDLLVVAVNSDASVRQLKGPTRPVIPEHDRARLIAAIAGVDYVLVFPDETPHRLLQAIRPDVLVKGGTTTTIVGEELLAEWGGRATHVGAVEGVSTTKILAANLAAHHVSEPVRESTGVVAPPRRPVGATTETG